MEIRQYIARAFPDRHVDLDIRFEEISGADLQGLYLNETVNFEAFLASIPSTYHPTGEPH